MTPDARLTVHFLGGGQEVQRHRAVIAGLPNRFRAGLSDNADIVFIGANPEAIVKAISLAPRAIVLGNAPSLEERTLDKLISGAEVGSTVVIPALSFIPVLDRGGLAADSMTEEYLLLESIARMPATGRGPLCSALFEQLLMIRLVTGKPPKVRLLNCGHDQYVAESVTGANTHAVLTAIASDGNAHQLWADVVGLGRRYEIMIDAGPLAKPAYIAGFDRGGARHEHPIYEGSHRMMWAALYHYLTEGANSYLYTLPRVEEELRAARTLLPE